ncbi:MAG: 4'-phosphopantetheinyl transferase superfamily protein [Ferruginibacter sp.]
MTGNDIVDMQLAATESNWKRKGYLGKIFTQQEQQYIKQAALPHEMVWRLWTMKESAYKIYTRQYGGRFFAPEKFSCTLFTETTGLVIFNNTAYKTTTVTEKDHIYTVASTEGTENTGFINACFYLPETDFTKQRQFIYNRIIDRYHSIAGELKKNLCIVKDKNGIPFINCNGNLQIPVSITHHGRFAAFTIH